MTREEVIASVGVDFSTIERNLGIGKNYFEKWSNQLKTVEQKYSDWWNSELKKREEMEVESSVRAATRANKARRLLRDRAMAQEASRDVINKGIAGGSIPAGWAAAGAAREIEKKALGEVAQSAHGSAGALREMMVLIREGVNGNFTRMVGSFSLLLQYLKLGVGAIGGFMSAAAIAGAVLHESFKLRAATKQEIKSGENLQKQKDFIAQKLRKQVANLHAVGKISKEDADRYNSMLNKPTYERNKIIQHRLQGLGGVSKHDVEEEKRLDEEHQKKISEYIREDSDLQGRLNFDLYTQEKLMYQMSQLDKQSVEYKKLQIQLDDANRDILEDQKKIEEEKTEEARKQNQEKRIQEMAQLRLQEIHQQEAEKFKPTLDELSKHGLFSGQARAIANLDRKIKRDYEFGKTDQAEKDIAQRNKIYDSLAARGVVSERTEAREIRDINAKMNIHLEAIASGKAVLKIEPKLQ